jgi:hypothetical protein
MTAGCSLILDKFFLHGSALVILLYENKLVLIGYRAGGNVPEHVLNWLSVPAGHLISLVLTGYSYCCFRWQLC